MAALESADTAALVLLVLLAAVLLLIASALWMQQRRRELRTSAGRYLGLRLRLPGYRGVYTVVSVDVRRREFFLDRPPEPEDAAVRAAQP